MTHLTEEDMVNRYYSSASPDFENHLASCQECRALYRAICETLEMASEHPLPARGPDYGSQVWARVSAQLPANSRNQWMVPALAASLGLMFAAGMWTEHLRQTVPPLQVTFVHAPAPVILQPENRGANTRVCCVETRLDASRTTQAPRSFEPALTDAEQGKKLPAVINVKTSDQSDSPGPPADPMTLARDAAKPKLQTKAVSMMRVLATVPGRPVVFSMKNAPTDEKKQIQNSVILAGNSPVLLDILKKQPDPAVRAATIRSLAVMGERSNILTNVYKTDTHEDVRKAVLDVLVVQQNSNALSELARDEPDAQRKKDILNRLAAVSYRKIQRPPP